MRGPRESLWKERAPMATTEKKRVPKKLNPLRVVIAEEAPAARAYEPIEVLHPYTRQEAVEEAQRCLYCAKPWCVEACPLGQDCREYVMKIGEGDFDGAAALILRDNPLASTLARVCYHYCEDSCVVAKKGAPVAVRHLKRAALEFGDSRKPYAREAPKAGRGAGQRPAWAVSPPPPPRRTGSRGRRSRRTWSGCGTSGSSSRRTCGSGRAASPKTSGSGTTGGSWGAG